MNGNSPRPPTSGWTTLKLLWKAARLRAAGRQKRQQELLRHKKGSSRNPLGILATVVMIALGAVVHGVLGWSVTESLYTARLLNAEADGRMVLPDRLDDDIKELAVTEKEVARLRIAQARAPTPDDALEQAENRLTTQLEKLAYAADLWRNQKLGADPDPQGKRLIAHFRQNGAAGFTDEWEVQRAPGPRDGTVPDLVWPFIGFILIWWMLTIVFQGEGLEVDLNRRRHPMWEWLFCHPIRPVAAFSAEMLSPLAANPLYLAAPVFWWFLLGSFHGFWPGLVGALLIGLPLAVTASCLNKALEIMAMLRLSPRTRGAFLGMMSWLGYATMMLALFSVQAKRMKVVFLEGLSHLSGWTPVWLLRPLTLGWSDEPQLWQVVLAHWLLSIGLTAGALWLAWWGTRRGLEGGGGEAPSQPKVMNAAGFGKLVKNPLYRKELLWLWRDKSAVVQAILIPLTIGSFQVFHFGRLAEQVFLSWNILCGAGIICGCYFLLVLGPRTLASEGNALWIAQTWPLGLEALLQAKARLWWFLSNLVFGVVLITALVLFPADAWRILLVTAGWYFFSYSLAQKAVTLVTAPSSSGEPEPASRGRQWAAMLGTFAFGSGVLTGNWHTAIPGLVFASLTAAAMWQNLRARLPHLFDPWSEKLPPAPSLMHAMIGIAAMVEVTGIATGIAAVMGDMKDLWQVRALAYGTVSVVFWAIMHVFLRNRGVTAGQIWRWQPVGYPRSIWAPWGLALGLGILLGGAGLVYVRLLEALPWTQTYMQELAKITAAHQTGWWWQVLLAVGFAPIAEEYMFRGLLYRALDREWGGARAIMGSAAFFAIYHPPVSWLPVFILGAISAWLFKQGGRLGPCVLLHMIYNAVVTTWI